MANKRVFKVATASAVAASALVAAVPASAASVTYEQAEKQVNVAREAANGLHAEYTKNADYKTKVDIKEANDELNRAKAKIAALSDAKQKAYLSSRIQGTIDTVARANAYNNAVRVGTEILPAAHQAVVKAADVASLKEGNVLLAAKIKQAKETFPKVYGKEMQTSFATMYLTAELEADRKDGHYAAITADRVAEGLKLIAAGKVEEAEVQYKNAEASFKAVKGLATIKEIIAADWTELGKKIEAAKVAKVESVSAITKTNVKVTFKALENADASFTVEVKDNNGNVVEVTPVSLEKGETVATLVFKTPLGVDPTGVWTVGGVKYDNDAIKNYNDIVTAASTSNEVTTLAALKKAGLSDIKDDNITAYVTAINASTTKEKLSDIQAIITKTNETSVTAAEAAAAVKAVNDSTNQVQLLAALKHKAFVRVNADWIVAYDTAIGTSNTTVAGIQALIDGENNTKIGAANTAATTVAEQNAVTNLIKLYTIDDVAPATLKASAIKASEVKSAIFGVKEATTAATVYNALVKLSSLDSANLPASALNANLKAEYLTAKNAPATFTNTASVKTTVVTAADTAASTAALTSIDGIIATTDLTEVKSKLQKLADVTSHTGTSKFDMNKVVDSRLADYRTALVAATITNQASVETAIAGVNSQANQSANLSVLKSSSATVAQVRDALVELSAGVTPANATTTAYLNASSQVKLEVAQVLVDNRSNLATTLTVATVTDHSGTPTYAANALAKAIADHTAKVAGFNAIGDLSAATISGTDANLDTYAYAPYVALTTTQQLAVAEEINKLTKTTGTPAVTTSLDFSGADAVTTLKQANDYIDAAIKKVLGN
ncbi:hypothetical protein [Fictibacillus phosphorivorans]|uniref:hypothetical protein n=1 Tax=Fictibacillus phosphorivorans TaxID=1221500 RepID=UPI001293C432|nr:hypothetical protein [Fictibacillus phosphorivorans]MQR94763.1 hypothetical protein [Fictibacillus phosphorivorans]